MVAKRSLRYLALAATAAAAAQLLTCGRNTRRQAESAIVAPAVDEAYSERVQSIFDRRCVVCHSCFDAPCQLNLQSFAGLDRGANGVRVYEPSRPEPIAPTRMFQDAQTTSEWRARFGFFPVLTRESSASASPASSLLWRLVEQRRHAPLPTAVDVDAPWVCPGEIAALEHDLRFHPGKGMPYGFPPLRDDRRDAIENDQHAGRAAERQHVSGTRMRRGAAIRYALGKAAG